MKQVLNIFIFFLCFFRSTECAVPPKIVESIELILQSDTNLPIIAIAGCPGVGKSTFAAMLSQELSQKSIQCAIINFDDFGKTIEEKKSLKSELDIMRIRWDDLHRVLQEIKQGQRQVNIQKINQLTKERSSEILNLQGIDLILFEGMYTLSNDSPMNLRSYADLGIYMETTVENICQWKWEREKKKTVSRSLEQFENHMTLIFEDFVRFVYPTKQYADWVIYADNQHEFSVNNSLRLCDVASLR